MRNPSGFNDSVRANGWPLCKDESLAFDLPEHQIVHAYWRAKSAGRDMPLRDDIVPRDLKACLPNLALVEVGSDTDALRIRLQGTALVGLFGEMTGRAVVQAVQADLQGRWRACFAETLQARAPCRFLSRYEGDRIGFLIADTLLAPLADQDGTPRYILASVYIRKGETWDGFVTRSRAAVSGR